MIPSARERGLAARSNATAHDPRGTVFVSSSRGRSSWSGLLRISLVAIPVKAYPAVSSTASAPASTFCTPAAVSGSAIKSTVLAMARSQPKRSNVATSMRRGIAGNGANFRPHLNCCDADVTHVYSPFLPCKSPRVQDRQDILHGIPSRY